MSTLLIQTLLMNDRDRKADNKVKSSICNWHSASLNFQLNEAFGWLLYHMHQCFLQCAVMREGQKRWGLETFQNIQFCTAEEEMKHCEYEYTHTNIHIHKHRLRPASTQLKHRTLPHPHCKQKCLHTPPVLPGFICTSLLVWKLLVYSHHYQDQPNKARKHGQDCFRELSCIYFSHRSFKMSNLTPR